MDDPELLRKHLPTGNGRVLVTTRYQWLAIRIKGGRICELDPLKEDESFEMFVGLSKRFAPDRDLAPEHDDVVALLLELGGLPLAIEQLAAYLIYRNMSVSKLRQQYARTFKRISSNAEASPGDMTLATVWDFQFEEIRNKPAATVLGFLALLSPDSIPTNLFTAEEDWDDDIVDIVGYADDVYVASSFECSRY